MICIVIFDLDITSFERSKELEKDVPTIISITYIFRKKDDLEESILVFLKLNINNCMFKSVSLARSVYDTGEFEIYFEAMLAVSLCAKTII